MKDLSLERGCEFMQPIYLFYLVGSSATLYRITDYLFRLYGYDKLINPVFLQQKMAGRHGDRDVVNRSVRSFLKTLHYFGILQMDNDVTLLKWPLPVNEEQFCIMLWLYAKELLQAPQISLRQLRSPIFRYFTLPDPIAVAQKYNGQYWDYQHRTHEDFLVVY